MRTVVVFGTFDRLHPGHRYFLSQARARGDRLIASVARDSFVRTFKGRDPVQSEDDRARALLESGLVDEVTLSDDVPGTYSILEEARPEVVCLGHDQTALRDDLLRWLEEHGLTVEIAIIDAFQRERYRSSLLNGRGGGT